LGIFVYISGYFIGKKEIDLNKNELGQFYKKRLLRIYPLYFAAICIFALLKISETHGLVKAVFGISMFLKPAPITLWFITMLLFFYLISPLIIAASKKMDIGSFIIVLLGLLVLMSLYEKYVGLLDIRIILYFPLFAFGIFFTRKKLPSWMNDNYFSFFIISLSIILSYFETRHKLINMAAKMPMVLVCSMYSLKAFQRIHVPSDKFIKIILIFSYSSYCMYLFHRPIYTMLKIIYFPNSEICQIFYLFGIGFPCAIIVPYLIQKIYDKTIDFALPL
jgi:peptidoglycan/LPS O-acetylase OafA/YrhL